MTTPTPAWTMAPPRTAKAPIDYARDHAESAWRSHTRFHGYTDAPAAAWDVTTAPDGQPMVTCRVDGTEAREALETFAGGGILALLFSGDQRPVIDFGEPGRVACVWRTDGVWVSLWAAEPTAPAPVPAPAPPTDRVAPAERTKPRLLRLFNSKDN